MLESITIDATTALVPAVPLDEQSLDRESKRLDMEIGVAQRKALLSQLRPLQEAWGDLVSPPGPGLDYDSGATWGNPWMAGATIGGMLGDRVDGRNRPFWETEQQLNMIRARSRFLCTLDCTGIGILKKFTDYVIGSGYKFSASAKKGVKTEPGLVEEVQEVIDELLADNEFCNGLDREFFERSVRDGETFLTSYYVTGGATQLRFVDPEQVTQPPQGQEIADSVGLDWMPLDWYYGIATDSDDIQSVRGYHVVWQPGNWSDFSFVPPATHGRGEFNEAAMLHVKRNVDRNIKRGCSDYYPAFQWLDNAAKLHRNTLIGSAVQAAIAYIVEMVPGVSSSQATSFQAAKSDGQYTVPQQFGASRQGFLEKVDPGTKLRVPSGQKYIAGPLGKNNSPIFMDVLQQALRIIGSRWSMPEFMVSGDASNANMASTFVAESPWVKSCDSEQGRCKTKFLDVVKIALKNACVGGRFTRFGLRGLEGWRLLEKMIHLNAEPPSLVTRDPKTETQQNEILKRNGVQSTKRWAEKENLDYEQEVADGAKDQGGGAPLPNKPVQPQTTKSDPAISSRLAEAAGAIWRGYP